MLYETIDAHSETYYALSRRLGISSAHSCEEKLEWLLQCRIKLFQTQFRDVTSGIGRRFSGLVVGVMDSPGETYNPSNELC